MSILEKVTAFIMRGAGASQEILLFQHPSAGIQIPAGTVEDGEVVEAALWREVREETGLTELVLLSYLGEQPVALPAGQKVALRSLVGRSLPEEASAESGLFLRRGLFAHETATIENWSQVRFDEYAVQGAELVVVESSAGWVPNEGLTAHVVRHFFHLHCESATPERWRCQAEKDCEFELFWTPLDTDPGLVLGQAEWLEQFRDRLQRLK